MSSITDSKQTKTIVIPPTKIPTYDWLKRGLHNPMFTSICL